MILIIKIKFQVIFFNILLENTYKKINQIKTLDKSKEKNVN